MNLSFKIKYAVLFLIGFNLNILLSQTSEDIEANDTEIILPPAWAFGVLYGGYTNQEETEDRVQQIIDHDYPIDGYWIDSWFWDYDNKGVGPAGYLDFVGDTVAYPDMEKMWGFLQKNHVKAGIWIWDCIIEEGNEEVFNEAYTKAKSKKNPLGYFKDIVINKSNWHNGGKLDVWGESKSGTALGNINFDNPEAVAYFHEKLKPFFEKGLDFFKLDRTAKIPFCKATFEATQKLGLETKGRGFIFAHSGNPDKEYFKYPAKWTDDTKIAWSKKEKGWPVGGLKENVEFVTTPGAKGYEIPFIGCDVGGYSYGKDPIPEKEDDELFIRWAQFGAFMPMMEVFTANATPSHSLAWMHSERADTYFKAVTHQRVQLFPYIYSYAHKSRLNGNLIIKSDGEHLYQYNFGKEFLVGPVVEKGATTKTFYLPSGNWIDYYTGQKYQGNQEVTINAPLERIPLLVRSGAIIPTRTYESAIEKGSNEHLILKVYPEGTSTFMLYEDDGISNQYIEGKYSETKYSCTASSSNISFEISPIEGNYEGKMESRTTTIEFYLDKKPKQVTVQEEEIKSSSTTKLSGKGKSWNYDKKKKIVRVQFHEATSKSVKVQLKLL